MKTAQFTQHFKSATAKSAPSADLIGVKRDSLEVKFNAFEPSDIATADANQIATVINSSLELFAKKLIADKFADWNYIPSESEITLEALYSELTKPSARGSRLLTKESLADFAAYYSTCAQSLLNKSAKAADSGAKLIQTRFREILGNQPAILALTANLNAITDSDEFDLDYAEIAAALLEILTSATQTEIDADAL